MSQLTAMCSLIGLFKNITMATIPVLYGAPKDTQSKYHIVSLAGYACAPYDAIFSNNLVLLAPLRLCIRK